MVIRRMAPDHPDVAHLLGRLAEHNRAHYGSTGVEDAPPSGWRCAFLAYADARPVGLIAVRPLDGAAHVLRLYVEPDARGRGLTLRLMRAAVREAATAGYTTAVWDTGTETPATLKASDALGARPVPPFGCYADWPSTRCFELRLTQPITTQQRETCSDDTRNHHKRYPDHAARSR